MVLAVACKPSSVYPEQALASRGVRALRLANARSGQATISLRTPIARGLKRPTREDFRAPGQGGSSHIWSCCRWGLPCHRCHQRRGALLPHHFTLAARRPRTERVWRCVSVALSLGSPPPGVTRHRASVEPGLSSPHASAESGHPTVWHRDIWVVAAPLSNAVALSTGLIF